MRRRTLEWSVVALAVLVWLVPLQLGWYADPVITDIPVYREAGERIVGGEVPYRDFELEYPPLAAALFALAALIPIEFAGVFSALMLVALVATALAVLAIGRDIGLSSRRQGLAGAAVALSPLAIGNLVQTRYDLLMVALLAWMVWAMIAGRWRLAWGLLAAATLAKLVPLALAPVLVLFQRHRTGLRPALVGLAGSIAGIAAALAPFALLAPAGTWHIAQYHLERPLQIESLGSAYLLALHALADIGLAVESSFGSQGLAGEGPKIIAAAQSAILVVLVAAVALVFGRALGRSRPPGDARLLVAAVAATLAALLVGGKVLSPQFLLWLIPVGFGVAGRYGRVAFGATLAAMALTQAYFPHRYWDLVALETLPIWLLVARDAVLIVVLAACWPRREVAARAKARDIGRPAAPTPAGRAERAVAARYLTD